MNYEFLLSFMDGFSNFIPLLMDNPQLDTHILINI